MNNTSDNPYTRLERIFHEPGRLTIMTNLLGSPKGMTFTELKKACELTDGNLSRHLKALEQAKAVSIKKSFVHNRSQTSVSLSKQGRKDFMEYLLALESVLLDAAAKIESNDKSSEPIISVLGDRLANA
jgi:DNA-binding MarR family transcriptional regulator